MMAEHRPDRPHWNHNFFVDPFSDHQPTSSRSMSARHSDLQLPNQRIRGGFDFRRPIMSQPPSNVIDLTGESSSPNQQSPDIPRTSTSTHGNRARRSIIELDDEDEQITTGVHGEGRREDSPDFELLYSRPLSAAARPRSRSIGTSTHDDRNARHISMEQAVANIRRDLTNHGQALGRLWRDIRRQPRDHHRHHQHNTHSHVVPNSDDLFFLQGGNFDFVAPDQLDFERPGFNMGNAPRSQPPPPTYDPPPPPRPGFTRTPKEEDILVCPNCDEELGKGDDDVKRQVWIVKSCGHV